MSRRVVSALLLSATTLWSHAQGPSTCTGLCQQQVACPSGQTTSISGKVYAPNGTDPLPNVMVYIPSTTPAAFPLGVSCPAVGTPPSGSPLVGTVSDVDGSYRLTDVPVGSNIPLVIVSGRWRSQLTVPGTAACADTTFNASMPKDHLEGDIPKIAIVTGASDSVECVLRKMGISKSEFTDPSGPGRINFYSATNSPGARISTSSPNELALDADSSTLNAYDVLMLPCQGNAFPRSADQLTAFRNFVNEGGRVYASHYSYVWMDHNAPFDGVVNWQGGRYRSLPDGMATVNVGMGEGQTLAQWLQLVKASTSLGQMPISTLRSDFTTVNSAAKTWLTLNDAEHDNPVMQFTFDAPVGAKDQCGRVLFDEYHVENPTILSTNVIFPNECSNAPMTPQEKLLEYSLFSLTDDSGGPVLNPSAYDLGKQSVGLTTPVQYLTWTNLSSFPSTVTSVSATANFSANAINCANIAPGASCKIAVTFTPATVGAASGMLSVKSSAKVVTASLSGTGMDFAVSMSPATGETIAGIAITTGAVVTPLSGFANPIQLSCSTSAPDSTCTVSRQTIIPSAPTRVEISIATGSRYTVVGYGGFGGRYLWLVGLGSGLLLLVCRRRAGQIVRVSLMLAVLATLGVGASGCGGKAPAQNANYTASGDYTYTVTVTDGFLTHTATYSLHVTAK